MTNTDSRDQSSHFPKSVFTNSRKEFYCDRDPNIPEPLQLNLAKHPVYLDPFLAHKLSSMGLIKLLGDKAIASCKLYRQSFRSWQQLSQ
ncbi:AAA-like domain-containing protein [Pleurocapsales cyanobacterium LEGE 10410]|nr:AAA-like domain-containing protein [Pleurocapsales cyanobacterium LEGE 10410]